MTAGRKLGPRATNNNGTGSVRSVFRPVPVQNALPNSGPKLVGEDACAIFPPGLGEGLRRFADRAFSLSSVVPIESTTVVMRDGRQIPPTLLIPVTAEMGG